MESFYEGREKGEAELLLMKVEQKFFYFFDKRELSVVVRSWVLSAGSHAVTWKEPFVLSGYMYLAHACCTTSSQSIILTAWPAAPEAQHYW